MEDFTLARFAKERTTGCRLGEGWAGVWEPPVGAACNASEPKQMWAYDAATLVFRHAKDSRVCIAFFVQHSAFGAWACREPSDVTAQQQFLHDEKTDRFCMITQPDRCLLEATSDLLY